MKLGDILSLADHGPDTAVGTGPLYPWGGLYGGQIVAQALLAASSTVPEGFVVHSLRAYFIRRGSHDEPVRYEIDRIRDGRSFCTRRVVARQAIGAILNLEASFQRPEESENIGNVAFPSSVPRPADLAVDSWSPTFERAFVPPDAMPGGAGAPARALAWLRTTDDLGDDTLNRCALAFLSDDLPTDAVARAHPLGAQGGEAMWEHVFSASLDHAVWFHRPSQPSEWHLHDMTCHTFTGARGLTIGHVFSHDGLHVATVAQEVLLRDTHSKPPGG
jgi:acyl-CoA thioesterase-2